MVAMKRKRSVSADDDDSSEEIINIQVHNGQYRNFNRRKRFRFRYSPDFNEDIKKDTPIALDRGLQKYLRLYLKKVKQENHLNIRSMKKNLKHAWHHGEIEARKCYSVDKTVSRKRENRWNY
ncbi:MAG: hypothetical protein EZS28_029982 [Streblomastix strix]|uniref:Uncharacterized protein n=1 Tax=Streblomastix strix TaxID=222440 RepID=A0A5J4UX52_9EUKA|nr:MAG: hypothetical protein EZS28_029982 [Streblomastix strix]